MLKLAVNVLLVLALCTLNAFASDTAGKKISNLESTILNNETVLKYDSYDSGAMSGSSPTRRPADSVATRPGRRAATGSCSTATAPTACRTCSR